MESTALDAAHDFAASIVHATPEMLDALTLYCAASHSLESFNTFGRLLVTSPSGAAGKTTVLDVFTMLGQSVKPAGNATSFALRAMFNGPERVSLSIDEVSSIFGKSGRNGSGNQVGAIAREGYRRTATLSFSSGQTAEYVSTFCAMAMAGLAVAVPPDVRTRCIVLAMKPKPERVALRSSSDPMTETVGRNVSARLHGWVRSNSGALRIAARDMPRVHSRFDARLREVWVSLFAVARVAGGDWPVRCLDAFRTLALDASERPVLSPEEMVIRDAGALLRSTGSDALASRDLRDALRSSDEDLFLVPNDRQLFDLFTSALGPTKPIRMSEGREQTKGWDAAPILAALDAQNARLDAPDNVQEDEDPFA